MNNANITNITPTPIPACTTDTDTFVIEPLVYEPTLGEKPGRFISMNWDTTPKKNNGPRRDLVLVAELPDDAGRLFEVPFRFNFLPRGRGKTEFKDQMESYFGSPLTPNQLAGLKKEMLVNKPVIVRFKKGLRDGTTFDKFLPFPPAQPVADQPLGKSA